MQRYDLGRAYLTERAGIKPVREARDRLRALLEQPPIDPATMTREQMGARISASVVDLLLSREHRVIRMIATADVVEDDRGEARIEEHMSVSARHELLFRAELPTWDELVAVRSLAWTDDALVFQILPPLEGPRAELYISVTEALHLRRWR